MGLSATAGCNSFARTVLLLAGVVAVGLPTPAPARAYRTAADLPEFAGTNRVTWRTRSVGYVLRTPAPDGLFASDIREGITSAAAAFAEPTCSNLQLVDLGHITTPAMPRDGLFTIEVVSDWTARGLDSSAEGRSDSGPDVAATTELRYLEDEQGWFIAEADIYLRADRLLGLEDVAGEVRRLMLHEFAHSLGSLHACEPDAGIACTPEDAQSVVAPTRPAMGGPEMLSADDVAGLCFLYPAALCTPSCPAGQGCVEGRCLPAACTADVDCPSGRCVTGACGPVAPELGDPCASNSDCTTAFCAPMGVCTRACGLGCGEGFACDEGFCLSRGGGYGEGCTRASMCQSRLCLTGAPEGDTCTRACASDSGCPAGDLCAEVEGRDVCAPPTTGGSGCALVAPAPGLPVQPALLLLLAFVFIQRRRFRFPRNWPRLRPTRD